MNCSVCQRSHNAKKLPFYCAIDARNRLYQDRIDLVVALNRIEEFEKQVGNTLASQEKTGDITTSQPQDGGAANAESSAPRVRMDWLKSKEAVATDTTNRIIAQADRLKAEIDAARKDIEERKEVIALRKSDLASTSVGSSARKSRQLDEAQRSISRLRFKWNNIADTMAGTRAFLCEEAARLYGLRQIKKGNTRRYEIGGVEIVEPHAMNGASPEVISTSLAHIAHILYLASHYLAIRLPSEIILPHDDYPRPTIVPLASSYKLDKEEKEYFPSARPGPLLSNDDNEHKRPRPLFIDKPLPTLAKEEPNFHRRFIEGVSLLAYDIAWACCSQGVSIGDKDSYEDVCNMGQNLWRLLIGDQVYRRSVEPRFPLSLVSSPAAGSSKGDGSNGEMTNPKSLVGRWSHGTMFAPLGSAEGSEFTRGFKIMPPAKLIDRLKSRLGSESPMLEWEKIEGEELEEEYDGNSMSADRADAQDLGVESIMTVRTTADTNLNKDSNKYSDTYSNNKSNKYPDKYSNTAGDESEGTFGVRAIASTKGTSGWTKLKQRNE